MQCADWVLQRLPSLQGLPEGKQRQRVQWLSLLSAVLKLLSAPSKLVGARGGNATEEASIGCIARKLKLQVVTSAVRLLIGAAGGFGQPCVQHCLLHAVLWCCASQACTGGLKRSRGWSKKNLNCKLRCPNCGPQSGSNQRMPLPVINHMPKSCPLTGTTTHGQCTAQQQAWMALLHIMADH